MSTGNPTTFGRSLSGYFETLLTPTGQQKRGMTQPTAEERWRQGAPRGQQQSFSGEQEGGEAKDGQWRRIVTQVASDYTKLSDEHRTLKVLYQEQQERLEEVQDHIRNQFEAEGKENITQVLGKLNLNSINACRQCLKNGGGQKPTPKGPVVDPAVMQEAAVNMVVMEIEERAKEFFMAQALELKLKGDMHQEEIDRVTQAAEGRQKTGLSRVELAQGECREMQERLFRAEAAAAQAEAENEELKKKAQVDAEERKRLQVEVERANGDQDAHKRQLEKVVRDRQLLALKAEDLSARAVQMQRNYEVAAEQLERVEHKAEDERDKRAQLQRELGMAQERIKSLHADLEHMKTEEKKSQGQVRQLDVECRDLKEKIQQAETEAEIVNEDRERLVSLVRITVEAFQYHKGAIFKLDGMKDLCANLELELSEQMVAKDGTGTPLPDAPTPATPGAE